MDLLALAIFAFLVFYGVSYLVGIVIFDALDEIGRAIAHPSKYCGCLPGDDEHD